MLPAAIQQFIQKATARAQWFEEGEVHVYLRNAKHCIRTDKGACMLDTVDVASITVDNAGQGHFTRFLADLEEAMPKLAPTRTIFVENVLSPRFAQFFEKRGYIQCNPPDICFIRPTGNYPIRP